jgi:ABC-2 type transport system permease protein
MNKFWIMTFQTYISKVKSRSFIVSTAIILVMVLAFMNLDRIVGMFDKSDTTIGVVEESGSFYSALENQLKSGGSELRLEAYKTEADAKKAEEEGELEGYLLLTEQNDVPIGIYKAQSIANSNESSEIQNALQQIQTSVLTKKVNITDEQLAAIYKPVSFEVVPLNDQAKSEEELDQARGLVYVMIFVIYFSVVVYASMIANEVAIEKSSRVMEILISSVSPIQQMFAKITGIALLTLTQLAIFVIVGYFSFKNNSSGMGEIFEAFGFDNMKAKTIVYAILFTFLGYLLYATMAACLGSLVSKIEDLQQMIMPMTMLVILGFMLAMMGLTNPEAKFITVTSYIPFFSPMLMFMRIGMLEISNIEIAISVSILLVTIGLLAYIGAKVYKGGVLLYGNTSSFKDIKKALDLTNSNK